MVRKSIHRKSRSSCRNRKINCYGERKSDMFNLNCKNYNYLSPNEEIRKIGNHYIYYLTGNIKDFINDMIYCDNYTEEDLNDNDKIDNFIEHARIMYYRLRILDPMREGNFNLMDNNSMDILNERGEVILCVLPYFNHLIELNRSLGRKLPKKLKTTKKNK